jgi:hypothetical protein
LFLSQYSIPDTVQRLRLKLTNQLTDRRTLGYRACIENVILSSRIFLILWNPNVRRSFLKSFSITLISRKVRFNIALSYTRRAPKCILRSNCPELRIPVPCSFSLYPYHSYSSALKMEAAGLSKTSANMYHTTQHNIPEDNNLLSQDREKFDPCIPKYNWNLQWYGPSPSFEESANMTRSRTLVKPRDVLLMHTLRHKSHMHNHQPKVTSH